MQIVKIEDYKKLHSAISNSQGRVFVLVYASEDPATGRSWCPDCYNAEPKIKEAISKVQDSTLIIAYAGQKPEYRSAENPYKQDAQMKITNLPTLFEWGNDGPLKKLVEAECNDHSLLDKFIQ